MTAAGLVGNFTDERPCLVQTNPKVVERGLSVMSDLGDLAPTCGSGTTAWRGRNVDDGGSPARLPIALARERLLKDAVDF